MRTRTLAKIALPLLGSIVLGVAPAGAQQSLTYEQARTAMDAAEQDARSNQWNLTIVIADAQGVPIYVRRMEGASPRTFDVAMRKVRTALAAGMATGDYGQINGRDARRGCPGSRSGSVIIEREREDGGATRTKIGRLNYPRLCGRCKCENQSRNR